MYMYLFNGRLVRIEVMVLIVLAIYLSKIAARCLWYEIRNVNKSIPFHPVLLLLLEPLLVGGL